VGLGDMPDDGEAQSSSTLTTAARTIYAEESIENPFERIRRNTRSIILDNKPCPRTI